MNEISTEYQVSGMTCGHCEMSVREEVGEIPGVRSVEVSHESGALRVRSEQPVQDAAVLDAVAEAGYSAVRA